MQRLWRPAPGGLLLAVASAAYGVLLVLLRGRPSTGTDAGVFLSVAARIVDGDHLYRDVFDNKDPLFFYGDAAALWVGGWKAPFLLDVLWVALAAAGVFLLLRRVGASAAVAAAGFVAYPLLLTGQWYYAGYSMLAGLALAPVGAWLWARGDAAAAGVVVALGGLEKVNLGLVLLAGPVALFAVGAPGRELRRVARFVAGAIATAGAAAVALAARGELVPYLRMLRENASYANDVLVGTGRAGGLRGHVRTVETATDHGRVVLAILVVAALAALLALALRRLGAAQRAVAAVFVLVGAATGVTLATTAAWDHHAQMLAYPGGLLAAAAALAAERVPGKAPRLALQAAVTAAAVLLLGGAKPGVAGGPVSTWFHGVRSGTAEALEQARSRLPVASEVSYAHLGQNDEEGHAAFLGGGWTLACARFHQYPWTPGSALDGVLDCVRERRPTLLLVTSSLSDREHAPASWHGFVVSARRLLARDYTRVYFVRHAHGTVGVWRLRAPT